ncbi:hypothetical protein PR202_ga04775 [Eleusine coracana subsp. coracana]|uniref:PHD-type domain-containing protein n=1 Tax=Eleusine coracana subsp. coracana TaxID=191504 RepID=A0AAV5BSX7_ELECO|nr:hypothetical protein PR202_ga04775 [Eleusine coracana subsp. coracana]
MTPKWNECSLNNYRELSSLVNGECKSAVIETTPSYTSYFGVPTANRMCSLSAQKKDGNVYKRRKMDKDSNSLAAYEEAKESTIQSCTTSKDHSSLLKPIVPSETMVLSSKANTTDLILDIEEPTGSSIGANPIEPITELTSSKDLCIAILKENGVITESRTRITEEEFTDANPLLACNTCGAMEHLLKMLMCDSCEAAFHLSCCNPGIKELPANEWFCNTCYLKKPKRVYGKQREGKVKPSANTNQKPHGMSHIEYMLKDTEQYVSGARIGIGFQADVPEWSGPTSSTDDYFDEPYEFDPVELNQLNWQKMSNENRASIGNWIQCQERGKFGDSDKICGKWRRYDILSHGSSCRAPLSAVQSDDWDCSCCLLWDPARADCAVPQELKTSEVLKQMKFVNMVSSVRCKGPTGWPKQKAYVNSRIIVVIPDVIYDTME